MHVININVPLDIFGKKFITGIHTSLQALKTVLKEMGSGRFDQHVENPSSHAQFVLGFVGNTQSDRSDRIRSTFNDIIRQLIDLVDVKLAIEEVSADSKTQEYVDLKDPVNSLVTIVYQRAQKIARRDCNAPAKVDRIITLKSDTKDVVKNYIKMRNCIEHNKAVAKTDIVFTIVRQTLFVEHKPVTLPVHVEAGQLVGVGKEVVARTIRSGEEITLSLEELENVVFGIHTIIAEEILT